MALITNIQRFCTHDGEGIRTTVFFKGCPLKCAWCHNPENIKIRNEILIDPGNCIYCRMCGKVCSTNAHVFGEMHVFEKGRCTGCMKCAGVCPSKGIEPAAKEMTVDEVLKEVLKDRVFYGDKGGITLSGGEPLMFPDFAIELLRRCKEECITTCVETCGYFSSDIIPELTKVSDMFLFDLKDGNTERHLSCTGVSNEKILYNLYEIDKHDASIILRCIMVKEVNMDNNHYDYITKVFNSLQNVKGVELLPYHPYGGSKNRRLGYSDNGRVSWVPDASDLKEVKDYLAGKGVNIL